MRPEQSIWYLGNMNKSPAGTGMFHTESEMAAFVNILYTRSPDEVAGRAEGARLFKKKWGEKFTIRSGH